MCALKRERWAEAEIEDLPAGEHDYFDRKSGLLFEKTHFEDVVAKALCAFANSGGGHLILGVDDRGIPDGLPRLKGRTPMRESLEQKIPRLIDFPLQDFGSTK
jgi:predicted HTH transcriptional regulator